MWTCSVCHTDELTTVVLARDTPDPRFWYAGRPVAARYNR
jgi:hypothetical protein